MFIVKESFEYQLIVTHDSDDSESYYIHSRQDFEHGDEVEVQELLEEEYIECALDIIYGREGTAIRYEDGQKIEFFELSETEFTSILYIL